MDSPYHDASPFMTPDGLTLYFDSDRPSTDPDHDQSRQNIWIATRALPTSEFGEPMLVENVNTSNLGEFDAKLSSNGLVLYIEDNSGWAEGDWDGDGDFTSGDLVAAFTDGGYEQGPRPGVNAVPEPTSFTLLVATLIGIATVSRTRRTGI